MTHTTLTSLNLTFAVMQLKQWALVAVKGVDSSRYLQGQLTIDLNELGEAHQLAGHCDAKGKMWSSLRLFPQPEGYGYLLRREVRDAQLSELKKYAIFSKVSFIADERTIIGIIGDQARSFLDAKFAMLPSQNQPLVITDQATLLWLDSPSDRFLIIAKDEFSAQLLADWNDYLTDEQLWLAADIAAGIPVIEPSTSGQFIPQATNLQALNAISFKKGCYTGQEMVARAKYRGANKRALYWLAGQGSSRPLPKAGSALELQMGDKWRRTGTVLSAAVVDQQLWVQAVLNNDLEAGALLRPEAAEAITLSVQPLPYTLDNEA